MGITNSDIQRKTGFFHALGKVLTEANNLIGNEAYKSAHNVSSNEIWTDSIGYAIDYASAVSESSNNDAVTIIGSPSPAILYPLANTNYETWFLDTGSPAVFLNGFTPSDGWVKPLINPSDVPNADGAPSTGYGLVMYRNDGTTVVSYDNTFYEVDYFSGLIGFETGKTPVDPSTSSGLGFQMSKSGFEGTAQNLAARQAYLQTNGPKSVAFQYTGTTLDTYLANLPEGGGSGSGSEEWQSSVNGYLSPIEEGATGPGGSSDINEQISYLIETRGEFFVKTGSDITGITWSNINATDAYFVFENDDFDSYTPVTTDDDNRFLLIDGSLELDTVVISATGNATEFLNTTVQADRIIEFTGTASTGLTGDRWQVTDPRLGMITTLDNKSSSLARYIGGSTGWNEYQYESTYKVNSQRDINAITTDVDYAIAINDRVEYEPSGDKSIDILVNGLEVSRASYSFGASSSYTAMTLSVDGNNEVTVGAGEASGLNSTDWYLVLDNTYYRKVTGVTGDDISYSGVDVNATSVAAFRIIPRSNNIAKKGDFVLWIGSVSYELTQDTPVTDLVSLEYVTVDQGAMNS